MTGTPPNWDALAPYWHYFEGWGLDRSVLSAAMAALESPLLYVGAGRGTYAAVLARQFGRSGLTLVDASMGMAERARRELGLEYVLGDVEALPLHDDAFASVLCATGVFEYLDPARRITSLIELARVCRPGHRIVITAVVEADEHTAGMASARNAQWLLERWFRAEEPLLAGERRLMVPFNAIARELGDRERAYRLLKHSLPERESVLTREEFESAIRASGLTTESMRLVPERGLAIWTLSISSE